MVVVSPNYILLLFPREILYPLHEPPLAIGFIVDSTLLLFHYLLDPCLDFSLAHTTLEYSIVLLQLYNYLLEPSFVAPVYLLLLLLLLFLCKRRLVGGRPQLLCLVESCKSEVFFWLPKVYALAVSSRSVNVPSIFAFCFSFGGAHGQ